MLSCHVIFFRSGKLNLVRKVINKKRDQRDEKFTISHKVAALQSRSTRELKTKFSAGNFQWWFKVFSAMKIYKFLTLLTLLCLTEAVPSSSKREVLVGKFHQWKLKIQSVKNRFRQSEKIEIFLEILSFPFSFSSSLSLERNTPRESQRGRKNVCAC